MTRRTYSPPSPAQPAWGFYRCTWKSRFLTGSVPTPSVLIPHLIVLYYLLHVCILESCLCSQIVEAVKSSDHQFQNFICSLTTPVCSLVREVCTLTNVLVNAQHMYMYMSLNSFWQKMTFHCCLYNTFFFVACILAAFEREIQVSSVFYLQSYVLNIFSNFVNCHLCYHSIISLDTSPTLVTSMKYFLFPFIVLPPFLPFWTSSLDHCTSLPPLLPLYTTFFFH